MVAVPIQLAGLWVACMLIYLLGDVLRIFSQDFPERMDVDVAQLTQSMWFGAAVLMLTPILMVLVSLMADYSLNRWANIILAGFWLLFNLLSVHTYPSAYDKFLLIVSLGFNVMTIHLAWNWVV